MKAEVLTFLVLLATVARPQQTPTATVQAAPDARVVPPPPNYAYPLGRTYTYAVEWHLVPAGTATVKMEAAGAEHRVVAFGASSGVVNLLYPVNDRFEAKFDPRTFCSTEIFKHSEEGFHKRETRIRFENVARKSILDEKNLKTGETKHVENDVPGCVTDVMTGFYYLASLPLQPGAEHRFLLSDGGKTALVAATVEGREVIKSPAGTFSTIRVAAEAASGSLVGKGKIWVWFTDDANHTPVQMRAKLTWGSLLFHLMKIEH